MSYTPIPDLVLEGRFIVTVVLFVSTEETVCVWSETRRGAGKEAAQSKRVETTSHRSEGLTAAPASSKASPCQARFSFA